MPQNYFPPPILAPLQTLPSDSQPPIGRFREGLEGHGAWVARRPKGCFIFGLLDFPSPLGGWRLPAIVDGGEWPRLLRGAQEEAGGPDLPAGG